MNMPRACELRGDFADRKGKSRERERERERDFQATSRRRRKGPDKNESPGNRIASNFNRIRRTRSVSVNKCSISRSLNVRFLRGKKDEISQR